MRAIMQLCFTCRARLDSNRMRSTALFTAYLALALVIGALLAYPVYLLSHPLIDEPMYRYVTRSGMLVALVGLWWFLRDLNLANKQALGYALARRRFIASMLMGLFAGVIIMLPLVLTLVSLDVRPVDSGWVFSWSGVILAVSEGFIIGLLVAFVEETFFRGAMFTAAQRDSGLWAAAVLTSLLYAALHFLRTDYEVPADQMAWYSGFLALAHMFDQYADPTLLLDSFLALFAVGMLLALVRSTTGGIALCIGLHAGWVMTIKVTKDITEADYSAEYSYLIGTYDGVIGYLALVLIAVLTAIYYRVAIRGQLSD